MTKHSDFLQKLSSTATPPKGREVSSMDELVGRELDQRCLDEADIKSSGRFKNLIKRLFEPFFLQITASQLNSKYSDLVNNRIADDGETGQAQPSSSSGRATRSRTRRSLESKQARNRAALPPGDLYDTKEKKWNVSTLQPGEADMALERAILQQFIDAKPLAVYYTDTDVVPTDGSDDTSSLEPKSAPRKGAAYDGDSFRDKDYIQGVQKKGGAARREKEKRDGGGGGKASPEARWAALLNETAATLSLPGSQASSSNSAANSHGRRWYGCFSTKPLPSEEGRAQWNRKPDLILLDNQDDAITWRSPKAFGELTTSSLKKNTTLLKSLHTKAYILFCSQPWRRYVLALSVAGYELRVHLFDRSGVVTSPPIKFHTNIPQTCQIIRAFAHADKAVLGFDPTVDVLPPHLCRSSPPFVGTIRFHHTTYNIISIKWTSNGFIGRCTNVFHVRPEGAPIRTSNEELDEYDYVVKDCWLEERLVNHEAEILNHIKGTPGVPELLDAWTVQFEGSDDTTLRHRPHEWDKALTPRYTTRIHRRLLMTPVGSPLSSFRSQRELLFGLTRALETHEKLVEDKKILHRDISPNNMIFIHSNHSDRPLFLIDFDYAVHLDGSAAQYPRGTGTLPFVSLEVLRQVTRRGDLSNVIHEVADDLESFFYVFTWMCVLYNGPHGAHGETEEGHTSIIHEWGEAALTAPAGLVNAKYAKAFFVHSPNDIIEDQFTPYFSNLKDLAERWKNIVRREDLRRTGKLPPDQLAVPASHAEVIDLIRSVADHLPTTDPSPHQHSTAPDSHPDASQLKRASPFPKTTISSKKSRRARPSAS